MTEKQLSVRMSGSLLGRLELDAVGKMNFTYGEDAPRPLSLSMPLRAEPYSHDTCEAYFGGLLPESEPARKRIAQLFGANANNSFSLLRAIGYDCAGAVSLHAPDDETTQQATHAVEGTVMTEAELASHIRDLPRKPLFVGVEGMRLSLAGAQDKAAVCLIEGQPALPTGGTPTTHILKPSIAHVGETVINEYLCMRLAAAVGLEVAAVDMRMAEDVPYLLVERYDRELTPEGRVVRIHQEDFCQALCVRSAKKYQADGGPGLSDCFGLTLELTAPAIARNQLLRLLLFNVLIGNFDAHGKNYSLLHKEDATVTMAPAYDLVSTRYYDKLVRKMAMKIAGKYELDALYGRHWKQFSQEIGIGFPLLRKTLTDMEHALQEALEAERIRHPEEEAQRILAFVSGHARTVLSRFKAGQDAVD